MQYTICQFLVKFRSHTQPSVKINSTTVLSPLVLQPIVSQHAAPPSCACPISDSSAILESAYANTAMLNRFWPVISSSLLCAHTLPPPIRHSPCCPWLAAFPAPHHHASPAPAPVRQRPLMVWRVCHGSLLYCQ